MSTQYATFKKNREEAIRDGRRVATVICTVQCKPLPDPLNIYSSLLKQSKLPACLLESGTHTGKKGRFSFICVYGRPFAIIRKKENLSYLKEKLRSNCPLPHNELPFIGGAVGYIGHEAITFIESTVKAHKVDPFGLPVIALYFFDHVIAFDHKKNTLHYIVNVPVISGEKEGYKKGCRMIKKMDQHVADSYSISIPCDTASIDSIVSNLTKVEYKKMVTKAKCHITKGDIFQIVLSRCLSVPFQGGGLSLYRALRRINPSPYLFHMRLDEKCKNAVLIGASPEIMVSIQKRKVTIRPLAGTKKLGVTAKENKQIEKAMLSDDKETAEHRMLVDLARNDIGRFCEAVSIKVTKHMKAEYFSHVMHIGSEIKGKLRKDVHPLDACIRLLPAGTLSGAPKVRALQLISELEPSERGPYGGAFGWFTDQSLDTCIFIRSALLLKGRLYWQTGAGIVYDSKPESEYRETKIKAAGMEKAIRDMKTIRVVVLDHYDSFTYNLVVFLEKLGASVKVFRTDADIKQIEKADPTHLVLSPGPGHPRDVALFQQALQRFKGRIPILGVCLGHQAIGLHFGAKVGKSNSIMHGKISPITHNGKGIFRGIAANPIDGCRYHSLAIVKKSIPKGVLYITARSKDGTIMGIQCKAYPNVVGIQFHPESLYTKFGMKILGNFLSL